MELSVGGWKTEPTHLPTVQTTVIANQVNSNKNKQQAAQP